jgi:hypothetical protein
VDVHGRTFSPAGGLLLRGDVSGTGWTGRIVLDAIRGVKAEHALQASPPISETTGMCPFQMTPDPITTSRLTRPDGGSPSRTRRSSRPFLVPLRAGVRTGRRAASHEPASRNAAAAIRHVDFPPARFRGHEAPPAL